MDKLLQSFIAKYTGVGVDFDKVSGNQCVQLINQFLFDILAISNPIQTLPGATAIEIFNNFQSNNQFQKILNTPDGVPLPGDFVYWEENATQQTGSAGDVALFVSGNTNFMECFGQNYPTASLPHIQTRTYAGCVGWIRFIGALPNVTESSTTAVINDQGLNTYGLDTTNESSNQVVFDTWHEVSQGLYIPIATYNNLKALYEDLQTQVNKLNSEHVTDTKEIATLNSSLESLTGSNKNYGNQALEAEKVVTTYTGYMDDIANELNLPEANQTDSQLHDEIIKEIVTLRQNQQTAESQIPSEKILTNWENGFKNIVDWILQHGLNDFLKQNNLQIVDLEGNPQDNAVADKVIAFLDDRFHHIDILEQAQQALSTVKNQVGKGKNLFTQLLGLFYTKS